MEDKCPFCGAFPKRDRTAWECGTGRTILLKTNEEGFIRGAECYETQLTQCQERLSQLEADHLELGQLHTKNTVRLAEAEKIIEKVATMYRHNRDDLKLSDEAQVFLHPSQKEKP